MKRLFQGAAALAMIAASASPALAQDQTVTVIGQRPAYGQDEISSATRTGAALRDTPQAVSVITDDLIEDQAMRSMADVVRYVPGVSMGQGEGHRDAPTLRGNSTTADFFVDGVRDDVQYYRDLYNAERIEVLKGPNAMIFGRGGGGGVINRVSQWADWSAPNEAALTLGMYDQYRGEVDVSTVLNPAAALRLNGVLEQSDSYRDHVSLERWGLNPTAAFQLSPRTILRAGYEHFIDERTVDRGVPSQNGRPYDGSRSAFFGNPDISYAEAEVDLFTLGLTHDFSDTLSLRNQTMVGAYDKFYQNVHAGGAIDAGGNVALQGYNNRTERENVFTQTDLIWRTQLAGMRHTVLAGFELGRQNSDAARSQNFTGLGAVNVANPTTAVTGVIPAGLQVDSRVEADISALYVQDQVRLNDQWQLIGGLRFDRFALDFDDRRPANADFSRTDEMVSPRFGIVYRPIEPVSLYASYSVSFLPQSGDQFASLNADTANLDPEEFENFEVGVKWDVTPDLAFTAALYRLDRSNTRALDPVTTLTVLTGEQRSEGLELGVVGSLSDNWQIIGGYAYQDVEITSTTNAAPAGRAVPLTPQHTFSLWNNVRFSPRWGAGLGVTHQSDSYASISNAVSLPDFTRVDAAVYFALTETAELQLNIENLLDETYWATAHNDNNITPGAPTTARLTLRARF